MKQGIENSLITSLEKLQAFSALFYKDIGLAGRLEWKYVGAAKAYRCYYNPYYETGWFLRTSASTAVLQGEIRFVKSRMAI